MGTSRPNSPPEVRHDVRGIPVSHTSADAIDGLERAIEISLTFRGDAIAEIDAVLAGHPDFVMGWLFKAGWLTQSMETRIYGEMVAALDQAEKLINRANDREKGHFEAVQAWVQGDFFGAVQKWEAVLIAYPMDLFALELIHYTDVLLGDVVGRAFLVGHGIRG